MPTITPERGAAARLGWIINNPASGFATLALSAANTWLAYGLIPPSTKTINRVVAYISAKNGTVEAADVTCEIYDAAASGMPNASIEGPVNCDSAIGAAGWFQWSGLNQELTAGVQYYIVFKNVDGAPATNYPTFRFGAANSGPLGGVMSSTGAYGYGWNKISTTDGSAWSSNGVSATCGFRVEYSDGSFDGLPVSTNALLAAGDRVYDTRETGVRFVTPSNATLKVIGFAFPSVYASGTPTANLQGRLYTGASPTGNAAATSANAVPHTRLPTSGVGYYVEFTFASPVTIIGGTEVRIVLSPSVTGDTAYYTTTGVYTIHDDANSKALLPFGGIKQTNTTGNAQDGSIAWTDTDTLAIPFYLILDSDGEFAAPDFPAVGNVTEDDTVNGVAGTYHEAAAAEVQTGVQFGAGGTEYTGSYGGAPTGGGPLVGASALIS
jgi:hypothetical protein